MSSGVTDKQTEKQTCIGRLLCTSVWHASASLGIVISQNISLSFKCQFEAFFFFFPPTFSCTQVLHAFWFGAWHREGQFKVIALVKI